MAPEPSARAAKPGLSLYANLLDPSSTDSAAPGTISRAPVVFRRPQPDDLQQEEAVASKQQISAASLRFQPTKRPQLNTQKPKAKPFLHKGVQGFSSNAKDQNSHAQEGPNTIVRSAGKNTLADWAAEGEDDDANGFYAGEKRQRGGRKKRKKAKEESLIHQNWDDIYDPSRPNNYEEYKHSDEQISEMREWKDKLYAHRMVRGHSSDADDIEDTYRLLSFDKSDREEVSFVSASDPRENSTTIESNGSTRIPNVLDDPSAGDSYSQPVQFLDPKDKYPHNPENIQSGSYNLSSEANAQKSYSAFSNMSQSSSNPLPTESRVTEPPAVISRAPVRYNLPPPPSELPSAEAEFGSEVINQNVESEAPRSLRPGQQGFAERLMSKYGWTKGEGLGASGTGIVNPLRVQVEKQKKRPDSEGGGFVGPGGKGKIIADGKKGGSSADQANGKFGAMSEVVILRGMVDGMDLDVELEGDGGGGLIQEIGEECGEKYGRVERVYIDRGLPDKPTVFVKFTSQLSALRAVNALEQRIFNGNTITARFYDTDKFEAGIYS